MQNAGSTPVTTGSSDATVLLNGIVSGAVSRTQTITVSGGVHLILADGASLAMMGKYDQAGIAVSSANSLSIYGQTDGTGFLTATGDSLGAGISGAEIFEGDYAVNLTPVVL